MVKGRAFNPETGQVEIGQPLSVYGPTGLEEFSGNLLKDVEQWSYLTTHLSADRIVKLTETMEGTVAQTDNWKVTSIPIEHYNGVAYRLDVGGKSFVYSGDMGYDENLTKLGKDADLVAIECSYPDRQSLQGLHLYPEDIGKLAQIGNFNRVVLTHLYPSCEGREEQMIAEVVSISGVKTAVAHDFYTVEL